MSHSSGDVASNPLGIFNASARLGNAYRTVLLSSNVSRSSVFAYVSCYSACSKYESVSTSEAQNSHNLFYQKIPSLQRT